MKICIIGGGAAGMMAAISASKNKNNQVYLYEKNEKLGKKLFITGKGRCNLTNDCDILDFYKNIVTNSKFMYSSLSIFDNKDIMELLESNGLKLKVERGKRVYPSSDKSYDVTDTLKKIMIRQGVNIYLNEEVLFVSKNKEVKFKNNKSIFFDKIIISTGGLSYPSTGSTGDGYRFAKDLGINIIDTSPSLVGLKIKEKDECKELCGLELKNVSIKIYNDNKTIYEDFGDMVYEDGYLDGPIILSSSAYINDKAILSIDLKPALDFDTLDKRIIREIGLIPNKKIYDLMKTLLPIRLIDPFLKRLNIDKVNNNITIEDRKSIINLLKDYKYDIISKEGYDKSIITKGGIDCKEINPKTMESKKIKGIYFAGEILDVDCLTGGFNLQIAFTTGYTAGNS